MTLFQIKGSAPQVLGAKMLVTRHGLYWGTVGGGKIEARCIEHAQEILKTRSPSESRFWNLQKDIGMSCGGEVGLFFDVSLESTWSISIFGAGHISQELCRILQSWSCRVTVYDSRPEWLEKLPCSKNIEKKLSENLAGEVKHLAPGTYLLCMTMGHGTDLPILHEAFQNFDSLGFIGVIGSDVKALKIKKELEQLGVAMDRLHQLASPLGLPIGNNTPCEIAISICALLLANRDGKSFTVKNGQLVTPPRLERGSYV